MGGGTKVSTTEQKPWAEQIPYLTSGFDQAKDLYNKGLPGFYTGETLAGFDPAQQAAQAATLGYTMGPRPAALQEAAEGATLNQVGGKTPFTPDQMSDLVSGTVRTGAGTPFGAMADVYGKQFAEQISSQMPGVRQQMVEYQPGGGSRGDIVQANVASAAADTLADNLAGLYGGAYQAAQGMRMPAAAMQLGEQAAGQRAYPSIMGAPLSMYDAMGQVGQQRRAMTQTAMDRDMARYNYEAQAPYNALNQYMNTIQGNYGGTTTSTTPSDNSGLMNMIGSLGSAYLMGPSDIRIKENIVPDGSWRGHNVYKFNYIGDSVRRRGVMAQEVELTNPSAVTEVGGIKIVNYGEL